LNIWDSTNFRLSPSHHQAYDVVWYFERCPSELQPGQLELVVDEMVRMVGEEGKLVFRYRQNGHFTVISLKNLIGRRYGIDASVAYERVEDGEFTTVFRIERQDLARYRSKRWTFAVLTQGKRRENLNSFFESIRNSDGGDDHEILVCGPQLPEFAHFNLRYHDQKYSEQYAEISVKKNDLAQLASEENFCVVHDRYRLDDNFFGGFEQYGYDFDFITVPQWYECGARFPGYCAMSSGQLSWSTPLDCQDYNHLWPLQYLNGGIFICKTKTFQDLPLNGMLFWNQAEDVELSMHFRNHKLPPRINVFSSATTMGITRDYTKDFVAVSGPPANGRDANGKKGSLLSVAKQGGRQFERTLRPLWKSLKNSKRAS
jgi:hypothetical protein